MRTIRLLWDALLDCVLRRLPSKLTKCFVQPGEFAFIVHPATMKEVCWKYPFAGKYPRLAEWFLEHCFWPVRCCRISGSVGSTPVKGFLITIPLTAKQMLCEPKLAERMVVNAAKLARSLGCRVVGLGGMNAWATHDGMSVVRRVKGVTVTTGHAATVGWMMEILHELIIHQEGERRFDESTVLIIGAAGLMGQPIATYCAEGIKHRSAVLKPKKIILVDVPAKEGLLAKLTERLSPLCIVEHRSGDRAISATLPEADIVLIMTAAEEVLIRDPECFKTNALIIDDTYPPNIDDELVKTRPDCAFIKVAVNAPRIQMPFRMPVPRGYVHTCLVGTISACDENAQGYSDVGAVTTDHARKIVEVGRKQGFFVGGFHGIDGRQVSLGKISGRIRRIVEGGP